MACLGEDVGRYVEVNLCLLKAFFKCRELLAKLPTEMWMSTRDCTFYASSALRQEYQDAVEETRQVVLTRSPSQRPAEATMALLAAQRTVWVLAAASQSWIFFAAAALLQFVVAPYSFAVSAMTSLMYFTTISLGHVVSGIFFKFIWLPDWSFAVTTEFVAGLLIADFLVNCYIAFVYTSSGKPKQYPWRKTLRHMVWGTFNSKTYVLVLLLFCRGERINVTWLVVDGLVGFSTLINNLVQHTSWSWESLFYVAHRLGHLPFVYEHAHKAHHVLQESTSFDGHFFSGSGFPEDWFLLMTDLVMLKALGIPPPMMSWSMLKFQYFTKDGHQRKEKDSMEGDQYHEDHHIFHRANYGFGHPFFDLFFDTYKSSGEVVDIDLGVARFTKKELADGRVEMAMKLKHGKSGGAGCLGVEHQLMTQDLPRWQAHLKDLFFNDH